QLLSELDQPAHKGACRPHRPAETFTPRFDVTETAESYELYGELPGLNREDLSIEFSDAQSLVIKGKAQRTFNSETAQPEQSTTSEKGKERESDASSEKSHTATTSAPQPKFWVAERKVGEFARSFSFSQRIEQDFVSADLKNGILHVVVPKSQKPKKVNVTVN
ncbi:HSP20-like chaperone, partial [Mollisia scopiformis]